MLSIVCRCTLCAAAFGSSKVDDHVPAIDAHGHDGVLRSSTFQLFDFSGQGGMLRSQSVKTSFLAMNENQMRSSARRNRGRQRDPASSGRWDFRALFCAGLRRLRGPRIRGMRKLGIDSRICLMLISVTKTSVPIRRQSLPKKIATAADARLHGAASAIQRLSNLFV